jgi:hypothetical protein
MTSIGKPVFLRGPQRQPQGQGGHSLLLRQPTTSGTRASPTRTTARCTVMHELATSKLPVLVVEGGEVRLCRGPGLRRHHLALRVKRRHQGRLVALQQRDVV